MAFDYFAFMVTTARAQFPAPTAQENHRPAPTIGPASVIPSVPNGGDSGQLTVTLRAIVRTGDA